MNEDTTTRDALISAARRLFARHGYAGTSVRAITNEAAANLGAITYHFGSKRELYDHVVGSVMEPLAEQVLEVVSSTADTQTKIGDVVRTYFAYLAGNPDLPQLMMQELALLDTPPPVVEAPMKRIHAALTALVAEGQREGTVRTGPAMLMSIFILSVPVHLALLRPALQLGLGLDLMQRELRHTAETAAVSFVTSGLCQEA